MKNLLIRGLQSFVRTAINQLELCTGRRLLCDEAVAQKLLSHQYRSLAGAGTEQLPRFADVGFRKYSQFEEDGILLYIFSLISPKTRKVVEICAGSGRECMAANLIINHGWLGYLFDGNEHNVAAGRQFFARNRDTFFNPPVFTHAWLTAENVNEHIMRAGAEGPIDLLSLDVDGIDYWLWKAISVVQPTVVLCETHNMIPADRALTIPYQPDFTFTSEEFRSASLAAMCKLGREKGYRLVGTHRYGFNAFFIKNGVGEEFFPEVTPEACLNDPVTVRLRETRWPEVQKMPWVEV